MTNKHISIIAEELDLPRSGVAGAAALFADGAGVPFIARYRKERTGEMAEDALLKVRDRLAELEQLDTRRSSILESLEERRLLSEDLRKKIEGAQTRAALEDLYLPYRKKKKTRAGAAHERGLEPLARRVLEAADVLPGREAARYVDEEAGVPDTEAALAGARDIIAEWINEDAELRAELRELFSARACISARRAAKRKTRSGADQKSAGNPRAEGRDESETYRDYFDWKEPAAKAPSHRVLAMFRGEREGVLTVRVLPEEARALALVERRYLENRGRSKGKGGERGEQLEAACADAYRRLLAPSHETEAKARLKSAADETAAAVFAANLRELLLAPPLGERAVLAVDPGLRTGCKLVCLDARGELRHYETIYPLEPHNRRDEAGARVQALLRDYEIEVIAVGNGTGGREAVSFLQDVTAEVGGAGDAARVGVVSVNEAGASVYSASAAAREEFPDYDVTVRGAVSIGRRLMDPLSELVKIDPKSIGVGQYQHDVNEKLLDNRLRDTVVSCVNAVGVELNTASPHLLQYVAGISSRVAAAIVAHRGKRGPFPSREELRAVNGLGEKTFEQAAGFLRVSTGEHPLDASAVHPERYGLVERMAADIGAQISELVGNEKLCNAIELERYVSDDVGLPTLRDIRAELLRPGRDPRPAFEHFSFSDDVHDIADLQPGMKLPGKVTNVTNFGAFVDIGVHRDGLIHISKLADRFVSDPHEVVRVGGTLTVTVMDVDRERKRIGLSLID
ncbi:MAG: Tex family protein [Spirochaetia bacterium]